MHCQCVCGCVTGSARVTDCSANCGAVDGDIADPVSAQLIAAAEHSGVAGITLPLTPSRILALIGAVEPVRPGECGPDSGPTAGNPSSQTSIQPSSQPALGLPVAPAALPSLQATGFVEIAATPAEVFAVLLDPAALALVIPGCEKLMPEGPNRFRAQVTIRIALIKARYEAEIELSEIVVPSSLRLSGRGQSGLGTAQGDGHVRLEAITPSGAGANEPEGATHTRLHYDYRAQVGGKVAAVGPRMLEGAARLVLGELFAALGRQANCVSRLPTAARASGRVKVRTAQRSMTGECLQRL
ncbi:MAG: hypothetical protein EBQ78_12925 [Betaproteobacteria bacterium]|nr:hypothetical protein [Betaproteobacteria bacterium]